ncbi:MAG TPA: aspartate aminotransferase family protein [Caldithrix abyssi]|uniref:Aspartate aminotransferase family protein n=1 Tax=Caldithrix abyssi TaxID=187145 RepID=A0A7V4WUY1_CALAY|nr:aspartate aminotransferase family protein [Caldithrix abyssi]
MALYTIQPVKVPQVDTKYRKIRTALPVPESIPIIEQLRKYEPQSMQGQPPLIWDRAEGFQVFDKWGNMWLDWSSGVLITNAGHAHPKIIRALQSQLNQKLISSYVFYHEKRAELVKLLAEKAPQGLDKVFLLTTGSEATENAIKLARTYGIKKGGKEKHIIVSFHNAFHGRTLGAQLAGGIPALKEWIVNVDHGFVQVPFPDGFFQEDTSFDVFLRTLDSLGVEAKNVAGVITESYQGGGPFFMPKAYAQQLETFCRENDALMIYDEVQAGFGRTGKWFAFEHYGVTPDLIACGKGISSSLPLAAVIGRSDVMELYAPGSMTSTHSGSPLPVASAVANLLALEEEKLVENAAELEAVLMQGLNKIQKKHPAQVGFVSGKGLVAGLQIVKPGTKEGDGATAQKINEACFHKGLLMFAPVGAGGMCIKISPPLSITEEALQEGIGVLDEACDEVLK